MPREYGDFCTPFFDWIVKGVSDLTDEKKDDTLRKPALIQAIDAAVGLLIKAENVCIVSIFAVMICVCFFQVLSRYLLKISAPWTEELGRYAMIYMVMLGAGWAVYADNHIKIDVIYSLVKNKKAALVLSLVTSLLTLAFCAFFAYGAFLLIPQVMKSNLFSVSLNMPMWVPQLSVVLGGGLLTFHYACVCLKKMAALLGCNGGE